jgi:hypothetical protein
MEEYAGDLFVVPEVVGSPREIMDGLMKLFTGIGQKFLSEAHRLDQAGDRAGALEAFHRAQSASSLGLEAAAKVAPYVHPRLSEAHDAAPSEVKIRGGLLTQDAAEDDLPLFKLVPNQVAPRPPPSEKPVIDLQPEPADSATPRRWKVEI